MFNRLVSSSLRKRKRVYRSTPPLSLGGMSGRGRGSLHVGQPGVQLAGSEDVAVAAMRPEMTSSSAAAGASQYITAMRSTAFGATPIPSMPSMASSSASGHRSPKRRRSPTKLVRMPQDLHVADIPIRHVHVRSMEEIPAQLHSLFHALKRVHLGLKTIPVQVAPKIRATQRLTDPELQEPWLTSEYELEDPSVLEEHSQLADIAATSEECHDEGAPEVVWNEEVHARLLRLCPGSVPRPAPAPQRHDRRHRGRVPAGHRQRGSGGLGVEHRQSRQHHGAAQARRLRHRPGRR